MIVIPEQTVKWFGLSDSFWGSLSGAVITGVIAILVFIGGSLIERGKRKKLKKNYQETIKEIHANTINDLYDFLNATKPKVELKDNFQDRILHLVNYGKIINLLDINEMLKESKKAVHILEYAVTYQEVVQLIATKHHGAYANIIFKFGHKDYEKSGLIY